MKRLTKLLLFSLIAAALVGGGMWANAAFTTFGPPVTNDFTKPYFHVYQALQLSHKLLVPPENLHALIRYRNKLHHKITINSN